MADTYKWAEALKINQKKLKEWSVLAPDGVPLIVWLLQEGHVAAEDYLHWASDFYELPILSPQFFSEAFQVSEVRDLQASVQEEWRPWYFPVTAWDGMTFVSCVEPPEEAHPESIRFVLADPVAMGESWSKLTESVTEADVDDPPELPPLPDMPVGLSDTTGTKPFKLNLDELTSADLFKPHEERENVEAKAEAPEPPAAPEAPVMPAMPAMPDMPDMPAIPTAKKEEPVEDIKVKEVPKAKKAPKLPDMPAAPKAAKPAPAKATPTGPGETTETVMSAIEGMKEIFTHVFVMKCSDGSAKLYKWDNSLKPKDGGKNIQVDLAFPTFLRIVNKTGMPYHGYLVDSPAHNDFFGHLNITELPGCVTAVPIKHQGEIVGVLVGTGGEELQKLDILSKVEVMAEKLTSLIAPNLAAAA